MVRILIVESRTEKFGASNEISEDKELECSRSNVMSKENVFGVASIARLTCGVGRSCLAIAGPEA